MAHYRLTNKADADLAALYEFGIFNFGLSQAQSYFLNSYIENSKTQKALAV